MPSRSAALPAGHHDAGSRVPAVRALWCRGTASSLTASAVSASVAVGARPLQRLRQRPFELFKLPAVYCPVPVCIPRGRRGKGIGLIDVAVTVMSRRLPLRRDSSQLWHWRDREFEEIRRSDVTQLLDGIVKHHGAW